MAQDTPPWLVVGLGNPGPGYAGHRHNVGAMVLAEWTRQEGTGLRPHRTRALVGEVRVGGRTGPRVVLAQPMTFMNVSGGPVGSVLRYFDVPVERLVVVHDELDIEAGAVRLKRGGGEGGHNGLRSISRSLETRDYLRVRLGIGRPPGRQDPADYVLSSFPAREHDTRDLLVADGVDAAQGLVTAGLEATQQRFHAR